MASLAYSMALFSPRIRADVIEITEFSDLALQYGVIGVPMTVINEGTRVRGSLSESTFVEPIVKAGMGIS